MVGKGGLQCWGGVWGDTVGLWFFFFFSSTCEIKYGLREKILVIMGEYNSFIVGG